MSTIDWPAELMGAQVQFFLRKAGMQFVAPFNGQVQAIDFVADRWIASITLPPRRRIVSGVAEALADWLAGGVNRVRLWNFSAGHNSAPGVPRGTLRGSPTLTSSSAQGADVLAITGTPGATLLAGDMLQVGSQLFRVFQPVTFSGGGTAAVQVVNRARTALAAGAPVVWNRPTVEMLMPAFSAPGTHVPRNYLPAVFDLEEAY